MGWIPFLHGGGKCRPQVLKEANDETATSAVAIFSVLLVALAGWSSSRSVAGVYVNQDNPSDSIELKRDGTFYIDIVGLSGHGRYEVSGDSVTLKFPDGGAARAQLQGDTLVSPTNSVTGYYGTHRKKR